MQPLFEKLQLSEQKNLLIQGLPSSIEKQFVKFSFAKNVTPLLKSRKIDFALVFAINRTQLTGILKDVIPALHDQCKFWVAYPKASSKIVSDLNRECQWDCIESHGYEQLEEEMLDNVWTAIRFQRKSLKASSKPAATKGAVVSELPIGKVGGRGYGKVASRI